MSIITRNDVRYVIICGPSEGDSGLAYMTGHDGVTEMRIVARHGPMDWIPYVEVYHGTRLLAEIPQHNTLCVEFAKAALSDRYQDIADGEVL